MIATALFFEKRDRVFVFCDPVELNATLQDLTSTLFIILFLVIGVIMPSGLVEAGAPSTTITVLYNNVSGRPDCITDWGFACLVKGNEKTLLFDTGEDGSILLHNMKRMNIDPGSIDVVVLSHIHSDHAGGLTEFLKHKNDVVVYVQATFPSHFKHATKREGATIEEVNKARQLCKDVYTTGEMGLGIQEQALIVETSKGMAIITGCAHPGIVNIVKAAKEQHKDDVYMIIGGFHLSSMSPCEIKHIVSRLQELGVRKVAPSHCTGAQARDLFRDAWGKNFIEGGVGAIIELPY
jgi:7,8-dihydropterin-6-yl-methyl-4-(beta-D-ribofuranosyl)aminobenzene 5'-phosphate synthase